MLLPTMLIGKGQLGPHQDRVGMVQAHEDSVSVVPECWQCREEDMEQKASHPRSIPRARDKSRAEIKLRR